MRCSRYHPAEARHLVRVQKLVLGCLSFGNIHDDADGLVLRPLRRGFNGQRVIYPDIVTIFVPYAVFGRVSFSRHQMPERRHTMLIVVRVKGTAPPICCQTFVRRIAQHFFK